MNGNYILDVGVAKMDTNERQAGVLEFEIAEALRATVGEEGFANVSYSPSYVAAEIAERVSLAARARGLDAIPLDPATPKTL